MANRPKCINNQSIFFSRNVTKLQQQCNFHGPTTDPNVTTSLNIFNFSLHCNYNIIFHAQQTQICPQTTIFLMSRSIVLITQPRVQTLICNFYLLFSLTKFKKDKKQIFLSVTYTNQKKNQFFMFQAILEALLPFFKQAQQQKRSQNSIDGRYGFWHGCNNNVIFYLG